MKKTRAGKSKEQTSINGASLAIKHSEAREVFVAGTFNEWQPKATPMVKGENGDWAIELRVPPGRYEYRLIVDGVWTDDPNAKEFVPNPHGGRNALLIVREQPVALRPRHRRAGQLGGKAD
jgi:1,4-alpha-glucan branching enzyme